MECTAPTHVARLGTIPILEPGFAFSAPPFTPSDPAPNLDADGFIPAVEDGFVPVAEELALELEGV